MTWATSMAIETESRAMGVDGQVQQVSHGEPSCALS
jgi:hypothetical protein